jgi:hypothetical protein
MVFAVGLASSDLRAQTVDVHGSDLLTDVFSAAVTSSGANVRFLGLGSTLAEKDMASLSGAVVHQGIAPMARNFTSDIWSSHATWRPSASNVVGLDGLTILSSNYAGRCKDLSIALANPSDPSLAALDNTLSLILAGEGGTGTTTACSSYARANAIARLTTCAGVTDLSHFFRLDDSSDSTFVLREHLNFSHFCNGRAPGNGNAAGANLANDDSDPLRRACVPADAIHAATKCTYYPTNNPCLAGAAPDAAGRTCTQGFVVALSEKDPGSTSVMLSIANRIRNDSFRTTVGYGNLAMTRQDGLPVLGTTINTVNMGEDNIRNGQYLLSHRLFLQRNPAGTGDANRDAQEGRLYTWSTNHCNIDPLITKWGFVPCFADCWTVVGGASNLCALPAPPAPNWDRPNLPGGATCDGASACSSTGATCQPPDVCPLPSPGGTGQLAVLPERDATKNYLGMNTWFLNDWDGSFAFADAMKHSRGWGTVDTNGSVPVDSLGWPMQDSSTIFSTTSPAALVNGTYKLSFRGQANVSLLWADGTVANAVYHADTNTTTADVTFANVADNEAIGLTLTNTKRTAASAVGTGVTDVRLLRPGYQATDTFTAVFLAAMARASVARMMDWGATNANLVQHWKDRVTPAHATQAGLSAPPYTGPDGVVWDDAHGTASSLGVAIEHQIQLCNKLMVDCWINVPVVADDDYVKKLALALRFGTDGTNPYTADQALPAYPPLHPSLRLYVEYANEIWNFAGGFYNFPIIKGIVSQLPNGHPLLSPSGADVYELLFRYPAWRTATISALFRAVYGDSSMMNRVLPVLMTQAGNGNATLDIALNWLNAYGHGLSPSREVSYWLYGAGGSGYYGVSTWSTDPNLFFATGNYPDSSAVTGFGIDSVWAMNFGLKHVAYEGGQGLDSFSQAQAMAINQDARMQDMMVKTHDAWSRQGGDLLVYYTVRGPFQWEFTPLITTLATPKFNALSQLQSQPRAQVTIGQSLPGTMVATDWDTYTPHSHSGYVTTCSGLSCLGGNDQGSWVALPGHAAAAFNGTVSISGTSDAGATLAIWINGTRQGQVVLPASTGLANSPGLAVAIPAGLVVVRVETTQGSYNLRATNVVAR